MNHELRKENGQAMIVTTLFMSGLILVATTVAGFLVSTQIRQATDTEMSARAIFAADAGIEASLYCYRLVFHPGEDATVDLNEKCKKEDVKISDDFGSTYSTSLILTGTPEKPTGFTVTSEGESGGGRVRRVLRTRFIIES